MILICSSSQRGGGNLNKESTLKNKKVSQRLGEVITQAKVKETDKTSGNLLYGIATKAPESIYSRTQLLIDYVLAKKITKP